MKEVVPLALYRKYRSRDFNELVGQPQVVLTLTNALKQGRISHAYLFSGPRGVGKTSAARILARKINGFKPEQTDHLDIIEIDAASNRRIDEIRDLREKVHIAPLQAKYKVYIIDEAHMLTTEAFNALLKTLEEPPTHAVFILATTEPQKLPETILSRTQRFSFAPVEPEILAAHLTEIAKKEKVAIEAGAAELLALAASGSVRDGLSLLDQMINTTSDVISAASVSQQLGLADSTLLDELTQSIFNHQPQPVLQLLKEAKAKGSGPQRFCEQLLRYWQHLLEADLNGQSAQVPGLNARSLVQMMGQCSSLPLNSSFAWTALESKLIELALANSETPVAKTSSARADPKAKVDPASTQPLAQSAAHAPKSRSTQKPPMAFSEDAWLKALSLVKTQHNSLYSLLRLSKPIYDEQSDMLVINFRFQFHRRRLEEIRNRQLVEAALAEVLGRQIAVLAELEIQPIQATDTATAGEDKAAVKSVMDILGGEIVEN